VRPAEGLFSMRATVPRFKVVLQPTKTVTVVYSPAAIERQKRDRAQRREIYDRNQAEIEARRKMREVHATRQAVADALSDQSTRH
jgi:hypothetical protein